MCLKRAFLRQTKGFVRVFWGSDRQNMNLKTTKRDFYEFLKGTNEEKMKRQEDFLEVNGGLKGSK